uniref:Cation efflux protein transmembrane domain-containing protein n=1 Tax=Alexandrium andersonii TaxID=327968 RepID=A0A7S2FF17_9DINO|mmetsp:Transcript_2381/g.5338  ORF Transcript_2381/g.5338 Transcript_2381/m.5338 type:complete len:325 (+) Transcript_2381:61-1035(+)
MSQASPRIARLTLLPSTSQFDSLTAGAHDEAEWTLRDLTCPHVPEKAAGDHSVALCACKDSLSSFARSVILGDEKQSESTRAICGVECTGNVQVLLLTVALFGTITSAQTVGALTSHSEALLADTMAMWVDCLTYALNIVAEAFRGWWFHKHLQLAIPAVSLSTLVYATSSVLSDAIGTVAAPKADDGDDVNPYIVLGFACWCFVFDGASLCAFARNRRRQTSHFHLNMAVASAHVAADLLRSLTEMVESVLILGFHLDSTLTDAWAGIVVSATILFGVTYPSWKWCQEVRAHICALARPGVGDCPEDCYICITDGSDSSTLKP